MYTRVGTCMNDQNMYDQESTFTSDNPPTHKVLLLLLRTTKVNGRKVDVGEKGIGFFLPVREKRPIPKQALP